MKVGKQEAWCVFLNPTTAAREMGGERGKRAKPPEQEKLIRQIYTRRRHPCPASCGKESSCREPGVETDDPAKPTGTRG